jgi:cytochrome P450/deferrochelatase/peroxidase EfeB
LRRLRAARFLRRLRKRKAKYFHKVAAARKLERGVRRELVTPFELTELVPASRLKRTSNYISSRLLERFLPFLLFVLRAFGGVPRFMGLYWVTRRAHVVAALRNPDLIRVPFGPEMDDLARGLDGESATFLLGLDGAAHERQRQIVERLIRNPDANALQQDLDRVRTWTAECARSLIEGAGGRLDMVSDYIVRIPTEVCRRYFGLAIADPYAFADWAISVSAILFADPYGDPLKRRVGLSGATRICQLIDVAVTRAKRHDQQRDFPDPTLIERLVAMQRQDPQNGPTDSEIRAIILGLVAGFIPTSGLAGAKMFETLARHNKRFDAAKAAGLGADRAAMEALLLEAGRLNPALAPGQWRYTRRPVRIGRRRIPRGSTVLVSTMSAMRDRRKPRPDDPTAENQASLMFGLGPHQCLGDRLAKTVLTEMFLILFGQERLRLASDRYGVMKWLDFFPRRLDVEYDCSTGTQSTVIACIPVETDRAAVEAAVAALGNPAAEEVRATLDLSGNVHFASCSIIHAGADDKDPPHYVGPLYLVLELNLDGEPEPALRRFAVHSDNWLRPLLRTARPGDSRHPEEIILGHMLKLHFRPWGTVGLHFVGTGDHPVAMIRKQALLRRRVEQELAQYLSRQAAADGPGNRPMAALATVRRQIRNDPDDRELAAFIVQPRPRPESQSTPLKRVVWGDRDVKFYRKPAIVLGTLLFATFMLFLHVADYAFRRTEEFSFGAFVRHVGRSTSDLWPPHFDTLTSLAPYFLVLMLLSVLLTLFAWALAAALLYGIFRWVESREKPDDQQPNLARMRKLLAIENHPEQLQNHITAVTPLKRGLVRRLALSVALWGIKQSLYWFPRGFVVTMGTIHYARWFVLPNSRKLIFQSNYDGSWESYLEDFIARAHEGQTAAWSNGEGFPKSVGLIGAGASDGDGFKRWVRRQQVPTLFWYSRFNRLTAADIRTNALVHQGLAHAATDTDARAWLDLLGSAPRQDYELESAEIQSLVYRALKSALFTACIPFRLPPDGLARSHWLWGLSKQIAFGKFPKDDRALFLGLSPTGLHKLGQDAPAGPARDLLQFFPPAFSMGMANRHAILGDVPPTDGDEPWRWCDGPTTDPAAAQLVADGVLLIYEPDRLQLEAGIKAHRSALERHGGTIVHEVIRTAPVDRNGDVNQDATGTFAYEHFGFRDGISTPIIRGTEQFTPRDIEDPDVVEPGEFIIGYRNNQGYFVRGIMVPAASDIGLELPAAAVDTPFGIPGFGDFGPFAPRDLGRNGSFLVIRQLSQKRAEFLDFADAKAAELRGRYGDGPLRDLVGTTVNGAWLAAKLMGRWQDGRPLVGNPDPPTEQDYGNEFPDNDFLFGRDDPRGHACPLGAHARRANARDSLEPDDPFEQNITRRHLLLRRGRTYFREGRYGRYANHKPRRLSERGLLFVALCADLERQFEFVQQSWLGFPGFHGLSGEPDPIATRQSLPGDRRFTIPTTVGPLVVNGMESFVGFHGGGYFFLPSRSAIRYLAQFGSAERVPGFA